MIGAEGCSTPAGIAGKLRPHRAEARGGSTHAPRKASILQRKSTTTFYLKTATNFWVKYPIYNKTARQSPDCFVVTIVLRSNPHRREDHIDDDHGNRTSNPDRIDDFPWCHIDLMRFLQRILRVSRFELPDNQHQC